MKRILLLSDTHSYLDDRILHHAKQADEVWHAGDIGDLRVTDDLKEITTVRAVYGNIDNQQARAEWPLHNEFEVEGLKVWITHIGGYPGRYSPGISELMAVKRPGLFITGHSHILKVQMDKKHNLLHMNPGAAGIHGFHKMRTMLRFTVENGKVNNLEVIELGPRGKID
ncbi:MAG: metallophosphoesterase family protein [Flavobacteriia bacterium]|nr:metallophosphoesterase family protein [Flavobacteriia bacterium]